MRADRFRSLMAVAGLITIKTEGKPGFHSRPDASGIADAQELVARHTWLRQVRVFPSPPGVLGIDRERVLLTDGEPFWLEDLWMSRLVIRVFRWAGRPLAREPCGSVGSCHALHAPPHHDAWGAAAPWLEGP